MTNKPTIQSLPRVKDRLTFLYLERCTINREDGAITVTDIRGVVHVPAAMLSVLMLGPGTSVTHRAMELIGDVGASVVWVGEQGVRYYAHGRPLATSTSLLLAQAALVSNIRSHAEVARKMYSMRFPDEDISGLKIQQLRGREGTRVRNLYHKLATEAGIAWTGRHCDFDTGDTVNKVLSAANVCLYGLAHSVIVALGCAPGLGFIHVGHARSFVYDIADLYKAETTIPLAFKLAVEYPEDRSIGDIARHRIRDIFAEGKLLPRMVKDIQVLLEATEIIDAEVLYLWDDKKGLQQSGVSYFDGKEPEEDDLEEGYGEVL